MSLGEDLKAEVKKIFADAWTKRDGQKVPEASDLRLGNDGVNLDGTVLYADLSESTALVDSETATFAAEIYKSYLHCAAKIIRSEGGVITAYDGDRIMAVYIGSLKNTKAATTALKINHAVRNIVNPAIKKQYPSKDYYVKQVIGIDTSKLLVARTGVRGANDLVWVGRSANHAAKLTSVELGYDTYISSDVYSMMANSAKLNDKGVDMWTQLVWKEMDKATIYGSSYRWTFD